MQLRLGACQRPVILNQFSNGSQTKPLERRLKCGHRGGNGRNPKRSNIQSKLSFQERAGRRNGMSEHSRGACPAWTQLGVLGRGGEAPLGLDK